MIPVLRVWNRAFPAVAEHVVETTVDPDQGWRFRSQNLSQGFLASFGRDVWIQAINGRFEPPFQHNIAK